jgi:hypothetical protein
LGDLSKTKVARYGKTITHTSVSIFGRTVAGTKSIRAGIKKFKYVGPSPERQWCQQVPVGAILTKDEIDALPSGPGGLDPFYAGGGWNCRHRWVPVTEGL